MHKLISSEGWYQYLLLVPEPQMPAGVRITDINQYQVLVPETGGGWW